MLEYNIIGLMSGTSVDGLDIVLCKFVNLNNAWNFKVIKCESVTYSKIMRQKLLDLHKMSGEELVCTDIEFARFCANQVNHFKTGITEKIDLIASHGHTVYHQPSQNYTLQIGNGETLAKLTGIKTICDFRSGDVALGGQGAPLVPIGDELLFEKYGACLNLGGFSNVSFKLANKRIAFDISPVNIVLNDLAKTKGLEFDDKGKLAACGKLIPQLLSELDNIEYYSINPPKSLSREWVDVNVKPILSKFSDAKTEDLLHTFVIHVGGKIAEILNGKKSVLVTGGGAYNDFLIKIISSNCNAEICIPAPEIIEFKEAIIFAFLGMLRDRNEINCLASVTGACRDSSAGAVCLP